MAFTFYQQPDSMDCGPTCLQMVVKHYNKNISLQTLRDRSQAGKEGVNLLGISEAAESLGLRTQSLRLTYPALANDAHLPAILHWDQNHFVVLYKIKKEQIYIADPARGLLSYTKSEFKSHWISDVTDQRE